jgi:hypothetical protein
MKTNQDNNTIFERFAEENGLEFYPLDFDTRIMLVHQAVSELGNNMT